jgi:hypothetical protein
MFLLKSPQVVRCVVNRFMFNSVRSSQISQLFNAIKHHVPRIAEATVHSLFFPFE